MTHDMNKARMSRLLDYKGRIGIEDIGAGNIVEMVVRIQMFQSHAEDVYHELGIME